jgi:hypothetical protein
MPGQARHDIFNKWMPGQARYGFYALVPEAGIEPARVLPRGILSPVRLPISPLRQQGKRAGNYGTVMG